MCVRDENYCQQYPVNFINCPEFKLQLKLFHKKKRKEMKRKEEDYT